MSGEIGHLKLPRLLSYLNYVEEPEQILDELRVEIQKGIRDLELGNFRDGSEVMDEIKNRLYEMKAKENYENKRTGT